MFELLAVQRDARGSVARSNLNVNYAMASGWSASLGIYNIFNTHAYAAEFWYVDRLQGEPAAGVADVHEHPLEPIMARFTISKRF